MADDLVQRLRAQASAYSSFTASNELSEAADALARKDAEIAGWQKTVERLNGANSGLLQQHATDSFTLRTLCATRDEQRQRAERAEARVVALEESTHYANGVAELAMKHRDAAEARIAGAAVADAGAVFRSLGLPVGREWDGKCVALVLLDTEE